MKKILYSVFALAAFAIINMSFHSSGLCDSPVVGDHSGAPGETNCTGCHTGSVNGCLGYLEFHVGNDSTYVPGQTYTCNVKMWQGGIDKFGFVNLALQNSDSTTIGTFNLLDSIRTRKYTLGGRNYFSHTPCGADADTVDKIEWNYTWTAPLNDVGGITFYISALAANHNHDNTGDFTYTKTLTLQPAQPNSVQNVMAEYKTKVFPTLFNQSFTIDFNPQSENETKRVSLFNLNGEKILELATLQSHLQQTVSSALSDGVYILKIECTNKSEFIKVMKQ